MFRHTRLKLTAWYLLIIMIVSLIFSTVIYIDVNRELTRFERFQTLRQDRMQSDFGTVIGDPISAAVDSELISEARGRLITSLVLLNVCILAGSSVAGYFLAGRTLTPIKTMLDDQARFIGDASHELKTPLTSLRSEIEVYLRSRKQTKKEADAILTSNLEEVIRLTQLTDSFMQLASYEKRNAQNIPMSTINLRDFMENTIKKVQPFAQKKKISIKSSVDAIAFMADESSLSQLFVILLDNAIKYSKNGKKIKITSELGEQLIVHVRDEGIGMDSASQKHIFDRFYRADKSRTSNSASGYGLGLSIAKAIAELHGGNITVKSVIGKGSQFSVILPV